MGRRRSGQHSAPPVPTRSPERSRSAAASPGIGGCAGLGPGRGGRSVVPPWGGGQWTPRCTPPGVHHGWRPRALGSAGGVVSGTPPRARPEFFVFGYSCVDITYGIPGGVRSPLVPCCCACRRCCVLLCLPLLLCAVAVAGCGCRAGASSLLPFRWCFPFLVNMCVCVFVYTSGKKTQHRISNTPSPPPGVAD